MAFLRHHHRSAGVLLAAAVSWVAAVAEPCMAEDGKGVRERTARELLDGLDERGMPDVSMWVLDRLAEPDAGISPALVAELPYRRALALVGQGRGELNVARRLQLFAEAQAAIEEFLAQEPPPAQLPPQADEVDQLLADRDRLAAETRRLEAAVQLGKLQMQRAAVVRGSVDAGKTAGDAVGDPASREQAAVIFSEAATSFRGAERMLSSSPIEAAAAKPKGKPQDGEAADDETAGEKDSLLASVRQLLERIEAMLGERRPRAGRGGRSRAATVRTLRDTQTQLVELQDRLRGMLLEVRLQLGAALAEAAASLDVGSDAWRSNLEQAITVGQQMYEKYRTFLAGQLARVSQGRAEAALALGMPVDAAAAPGESERDKQFAKALATLADVRSLSGGGAVDSLRARAFNASLQCWLETLTAEQYAAFDGLTADAIRLALAGGPTETLDADWLGFKYRTALLLSRLQAASAQGQGPKNPLLANASRTIQQLATTVAKANRDFASDARELLAAEGTAKLAESSTFEGLLDTASIAVDTMRAKQAEAKQFAERGDASAATAAAEAATAARDQAMAVLRRGLARADEGDDAAVNRARYLLTFLLYDAGRYLDAAALGEYLATWYPNGVGSLQAARVAMASWQKLSASSDPGLAAAAKRRCGRAAELILKSWPQDPSARDAATVAIAAAASAGEPQRVLDVVGSLPADAREPMALLRAGVAVRNALVAAGSATTEEGAPPEEAARWRREAASLIDQGLAMLPEETRGSELAVAAALARCQIALEDGDLAMAEKLLAEPRSGLWTIVSAAEERPDGAVGGMTEDILRVALQYFIQAERIDDAAAAMAKLEAVAGDSDRLVLTYLQMGRDLEQQLKAIAATAVASDLDAEGKRRAAAILAGFERFLDAIATRDKRLSSQLWAATTYQELGSAGLGEGSSQGLGVVVPRAKADAFLARAAEAYEAMLASDDAELKKFEPSIRFKLARLYRAIGRFDEAMVQVDQVLGDASRVNWLDGQIEAATILQQAGESAGDSAEAAEFLKQAIVGRKQPSTIWGWGGIATRLSKQAVLPPAADDAAREARQMFFEARLQVALCRKELAEHSAGRREDVLAQAARDIEVTYRLYPDLGGKLMRDRFERLLEQIQQAQGKPAEGLAAVSGVAGASDGAATTGGGGG